MSTLSGVTQDLLPGNDAELQSRARSQRSFGMFVTACLAILMFLLLAFGASGCGGGGYAGGGLTSISASAVTIDAGQSFSVTTQENGVAAVGWVLSGAKCSGAGCGSLSATEGLTTTYTAPAGLASQLLVTLTASLPGTQSREVVSITVNPDPVISGVPPPGVVGVPYSSTLTASGGTGALVMSFASGNVPAGLTFNPATGVISGTPTTVGTSAFSVQAVDASNVPFTVQAYESIAITTTASLPTITGNPPAGTVGTPYTTSLAAIGGTAPYSFSILSGSLPAGLTLASATGVIAGTPTVMGTATFNAQVQDAAGLKASASFSISIANGAGILTLTTATLPNGTVGIPYSATIGIAGGTAPYTCVFTAGTLPSGLSLSGCVVSGTPTAATTANLTVKATDSANPAATGSGPESITIVAAPSLAISSPPGGSVGTPYTGTIPVSGGNGPYTCAITAGTLPAGLTISGCVISGTPTVAGTNGLTIKATDSSNPATVGSGPITLIIAPAALAISTGTLPNGTVGVPYSSTIGVSGGTSPYSCTFTTGTLPAGLALGANCLVSGTPTAAGAATLTVKATDSGNPSLTASGQVSITIVSAPSLTITSPPSGTVGTPYTGTIPVSGGTGPYTCKLNSGALEAGLTLGANCIITGTPTAAGSAVVVVQATDSKTPATVSTGSVTVTINPAALAISTGTLPNGTVGVAYSSTIGVANGTGPYTCTITSGTLPAGLSLGANCLVSGTPTVAGTVSLGVKATDSSNPALTATGTVGLTINPAPVVITTGKLPNGTVGVAYSSTIGVTGGTSPYTCTITSGTLPAGLALGANCLVSGTPTIATTANLVVKATDSSNPTLTASGPVSITIVAAPVTITLGNPPAGTVGAPYTGIIPVGGGTGPYTCTLTSGTLPAGLTLNNCTLTGTPTAPGTSPIVIGVTDSSNPPANGSGPVTITINPGLAISTGTLPNGTVGVAYSSTIGVANGTGPYTCTITSGTLPAGLSLGANCLVSGTPTVAGTVSLGVKATDSSNPALTATGTVGLTINPAPVVITTGKLPNGTVGVAYSSTIGVTGGTSPYTCTITSGTLPAGLALGANCLVSGTPTIATTANLVVKATDSSNPTLTASGPVSITIVAAPVTITLGNPPAGTVGAPYTGIIPVGGGTGPYTCTLTSGTLPAGLTLNNCTLTGTPTAPGTSPIVIGVTDSSNPPANGSGPVTITINPGLAISTGTLPNGTVGVAYSSTIGVANGTGPYTCTITSGTLPAGLSLGANCLVSGTPTVAGTVSLGVKATDSSNPALTATGTVGLTINPAPVVITTGKLPNGTVGVAYSSTIGVTGGTSPYTCTITSGTLPAGLALGANCLVSGTPTIATTANLVVKATDSSNPTLTASGPVSITIVAAPVTITLGNPPAGTVGAPYTGIIPVGGGTGPYTCTLTSGTLPAGLTLNNCTLTGTPTAPGTSPIVIGVTDSSNPPANGSGPVTITINPAPVVLTLNNPPAATVGTPYTGVIPVTGGTGPYTCTLNSGVVPAGLTLTNCTLTGTPTTPGSPILNITATDSSNPVGSTTGNVTVTVNPIPKLTLTGALPNATVGVPYTQTLHAAGGVAPYTYALTAGALPAGLTLSASGVISGTPTVVGASSFTVTATDTETTPQTASLPLVLLVTYPATPTDSELKGPYAFLFQGCDDHLVGVLAYQTATVGSFTADGLGGIANGELDANHQTSNPTGATVASNLFLGTYTLGTDNRGSLTITTLNPDGTTAQTTTYAIAVKAPVAPATTSAQGSLIEFDGNQVRGTKGSGSLLQQNAASFTTGLTGSYAFGLSGDLACIPACTVGLVAGPVASVGEFAVDGKGNVTAGTSDANIANLQYTNQALSGTYGAADSNGRVQLSLTTAGTPAVVYPTDYAVYMVNANQAFLLSTDKHSVALLLAGSAQSQTLPVFNNTSLSGPFIGYENAATNPGLVGATLANVANLSTATIFRETADATGTCNVTNVDVGGATQLVNGLTGLGSGAPIINALLGTYQSTGTAICTVAGTGRGVLNYPLPNSILAGTLGLLGLGDTPPPARVVYLAGTDRGYFLETGYAGLGQIEPQTVVSYNLGTFSGTFLFGETPASSAATINASGFITANGAGAATSTEDLNVGVGTLNVLQLGVTHNETYAVPDGSGRFLLNDTTVADTSVVYVISPGRFVLLDTNPLTTSPSVNILY